MDLMDRTSIEGAVGTAASRHGGLDALVANAVRWPTDAAGPLGESDPDVWQKALRANLEGTASTVRAAWPLLAASAHGRIVLISAGVTRHGMAGSSAYAAAKAGLEGLVAALKWEGAEVGILSNVVAPGFTVTEDNLATFPDEVREQLRAPYPSGPTERARGRSTGRGVHGEPGEHQHDRLLPPCRRWHRLRDE
jgi:NAD(P)-dependent dehydrogenase (short-subunit alcohol dehydrogenase family)